MSPGEWLFRAEKLITQHYGEIEAFREPEPISIAELDIGKPITSIGPAFREAYLLETIWLYLDRESKEFKQLWWELHDTWLALQDHIDNDCTDYNARCRLYGREAFIHKGSRPIEPLEDFQDRLLLRRLNVGSAYRVVKDRDPKPEDYLTPKEQLRWHREGCAGSTKDHKSVVAVADDAMRTLKKGWEEIKTISTPARRRLALQALQKQLGMTPKDFQGLIKDMTVEQSEENEKFSKFSDLMAAEKIQDLVVDRLVASGTVSMIAAEGGCGKTSLLYQIIEAVSTGEPLFGQLAVKTCNVLIIQADESQVNARKKLIRMGLKPDDSRVRFEWQWSPAQLFELELKLQREKVGLLCMDSFGTLFGGDGASMNDADAGLWMYELNRLAARTGCAIVITHHLKKENRKSDGEGGERQPSLNDFFGSSYIVNGIRDAWAMWRRGKELDGSPMFGLKYLKDNSGLMERDFVLFLTGCEESHRLALHEGSGGIEELQARGTIRSQLHQALKLNSPNWMTHQQLIGSITCMANRNPRAVQRELSNLLEQAATTGIERRAIPTHKRGRPSYEYRFARGQA
jgi:hypothetical protein